jgi:hypothetical protein
MLPESTESFLLFLFLFLTVLGFELRAYVLSRQVLSCLNHTPSTFLLW